MFRNFLSILAGLAAAMATMMICEYINSQFFPFPEGMDLMDAQVVRNFTNTLPWYAFILVLVGWAGGSFLAGMVVRKISKSTSSVPPVTVVLLLTFFALINIWMLEHPLWFIIIGLPQFALMTRLGWKMAK